MCFITICKYVIVLLVMFLAIGKSKNDSVRVNSSCIDKEIKNISGINWTFFSRKTCGLIDRNLYLPNGTFESILFFSSQPFSIVVEEDSSISLISGLAMSKQIGSLEEIQIKNNFQFYQISRNNRNSELKQKNTMNPIAVGEQGKIYFSNFSIYGACKTFAFSTDTRQITLQITFYPNIQQHLPQPQQTSNYPTKITTVSNRQLEQQNQQNDFVQENNENRVEMNIGITIYCIDRRSIKQANLVLSKLYELVVMCVIGLTLSFNALKNVPSWVSCVGLLSCIVVVYRIDSWYYSLLTTYCTTLITAILYYLYLPHHSPNRSHLLTRSFIILSLATVFPLGIKSHLDNDNIQHKRILIHLVNIVTLCNVLLYTQSVIHIQRFRHAFYYFVGFAVVEYLFQHKVQHMVTFNLLQVQAFTEPVQCRSLFFTIMLIPLCDFFFKSYSSDLIFKFLILTVPLVIYPFSMSLTTSFIVWITLWIVKQLIKGKDISNVIKHKS